MRARRVRKIVEEQRQGRAKFDDDPPARNTWPEPCREHTARRRS
jgi:hypothetical protein